MRSPEGNVLERAKGVLSDSPRSLVNRQDIKVELASDAAPLPLKAFHRSGSNDENLDPFVTGKASKDQNDEFASTQLIQKLRQLQSDADSLLDRRNKNTLSPRKLKSPHKASKDFPRAADLSPTKTPSARRRPNIHASEAPTNPLHLVDFVTTSLLNQISEHMAYIESLEGQLRTRETGEVEVKQRNKAMEYKMRNLEDTIRGYEEESWKHELDRQDIDSQMQELQAKLNRGVNDVNRLTQQLQQKSEAVELLQVSEVDLNQQLSALQAKLDFECQENRKKLDELYNDNYSLQEKVDLLEEELEKQKQLRDTEREFEQSNLMEVCAEQLEDLQTTPTHSPFASPIKATPSRNEKLESDTYKASLAHSHRLIISLKSNLQKERTEKLELKRKLEKAQATKTKSSEKESRTVKPKDSTRKLNSNLLGANRRTVTEVELQEEDDSDWEDRVVGTPIMTNDIETFHDVTETDSEHYITGEELSIEKYSDESASDEDEVFQTSKLAPQQFFHSSPITHPGNQSESRSPDFELQEKRSRMSLNGRRVDPSMFATPQVLSNELRQMRSSPDEATPLSYPVVKLVDAAVMTEYFFDEDASVVAKRENNEPALTRLSDSTAADLSEFERRSTRRSFEERKSHALELHTNLDNVSAVSPLSALRDAQSLETMPTAARAVSEGRNNHTYPGAAFDYNSFSINTLFATRPSIFRTISDGSKIGPKDLDQEKPESDFRTPVVSYAHQHKTQPQTQGIQDALEHDHGMASACRVLRDPLMSVTRAMIGGYFWKYFGRSHRRHRRYFWVHPYTRTLYWSIVKPSDYPHSFDVKGIPIEALQVYDDVNIHPPGLHQRSIKIFSSRRNVTLTATSSAMHDEWESALKYLMQSSRHERPVTGRLGSPQTLHRHNSRRKRQPQPDTTPTSGRLPSRDRFEQREHDPVSLSRGPVRSATSIAVVDALRETPRVPGTYSRPVRAYTLDNVRVCCNGKHDVSTLYCSKRGSLPS